MLLQMLERHFRFFHRTSLESTIVDSRWNRGALRARPGSHRKFAATRDSFQRHQQTIRDKTDVWRTAIGSNRIIWRKLAIHHTLRRSAVRVDYPKRHFPTEPRVRSLSVHF